MKCFRKLSILPLFACSALWAQTAITPPKSLPAPMVPMSIALPAGHEPFFRVHAQGFQNYTCAKTKDAVAWTLTGPDAQLYDEESRPIGTHYAVPGFGPGPAPAWRLSDGSEIVGQKVAAVDAPDGKGVQWLLLKVISNQKRGILADVVSVQRVYTVGGKPPEAGCTTTSLGTQTRSQYTADYYFAK